MVLQKIRNENGMNLKIRENSYMKFICSLSFFGKMTFKKPPSKTHQLGKHTAAVPESTTPCGEQACHNAQQEHSLQAPRCLGYDRGTEPFWRDDKPIAECHAGAHVLKKKERKQHLSLNFKTLKQRRIQQLKR